VSVGTRDLHDGDGLPGIPASAPRSGIPAWPRRACWWFFHRLGGWRFEGDFPDVPRLVIIVAPHSSAWDAIWGLAAKIGLDLDIAFMAKREAFIGPLGWLLRWAGGLPVDRAAPGGIAAQVAEGMRQRGHSWFLLAPEGTRRRVREWKSGFWKIARAADAPVLCVAFDYPSRTIHLGPVLAMGEDLAAEMARVRAWYRPFIGKNRGV
jgi:1-acyl-sn-glycerol-3-phosphate acyltransferase